MANRAKTGTINFRIEGGRKLHGKIAVRTSKNGTVAVLAAALLNHGKTTIKKAPKIEEVFRIIEVMESIGVSAKWRGDDVVIIPPKKFDIKNIDFFSAEKTRSALLLIAPLIHFSSRFVMPGSGGCHLGSRTIKPYFYALESIGVKMEAKNGRLNISRKKLNTAEIVLYEAGDTVSELIITAAALIPGKTTVKFASANYQVQDVCFFLEKLGVKVEGVGTSTLVVHGVEKIEKDVSYEPGEDPIEAMSLIAAAIVTKSAITITRAPIDFLELELFKLRNMGFRYSLSKRYKGGNGKINLVDIKTSPSNLVALPEKIHALPYPGINMDNLPFFAIIGTQAEGETFIHDWVYEERAVEYKEIDKLGAHTVLADPHRFYVKGKTTLHAAEIICPPALRPSVIILIGMLAAKGVSILRNVYNINRGYEDLATRLNAIGAKIETFKE